MSGLYELSDIPKKHKNFRPKDNTSPEWIQAYESIKKIIESGPIIAMAGNRGSGKTQLAACVVGYATIDLSKPAKYQKAMDVFLSIREAIRTTGDSEKKAIDGYVKPWLLVVDAFEVRSDSDFENRMMDHIIDKRYDNMHPTIIISNQTKNNLMNDLGPSVCDRIRESGAVYEFTWKSFRAK
jgi:DNA replication protein DnaC